MNNSGYLVRSKFRAIAIAANRVLPVTFDCWRVQILAIRGAGANLKIEGVSYLSGATGPWPGVVRLGGVLVDGKPVPFKQTINFAAGAAAVTAADWMIVEEYLEPVPR